MAGKVAKVIVHPRWKQVLIWGFWMCIFWYTMGYILLTSEFTFYFLPAYVSLIVVTCSFLGSGVHYAFCSEYLELGFFYIPVRRIAWEKVEKAVYLHAWKDIRTGWSPGHRGVTFNSDNSFDQMIYVTLKGCPGYFPQSEIRLFHSLRHIFRTASIFLPYEMKYYYLEKFQEVYPELEMQPLDAWKKM